MDALAGDVRHTGNNRNPLHGVTREEMRILRHDLDPRPMALGKLVVTQGVRLFGSEEWDCTREIESELPETATATTTRYFLRKPNYSMAS